MRKVVVGLLLVFGVVGCQLSAREEASSPYVLELRLGGYCYEGEPEEVGVRVMVDGRVVEEVVVALEKKENWQTVNVALDGGDRVITVEAPGKVKCTFVVDRDYRYASVTLDKDMNWLYGSPYEMEYTLSDY